MASFAAQNLYILTGQWFDLRISRLYDASNYFSTNNQSGETFQVPEFIDLYGQDLPILSVQYWGYYEQGWIGAYSNQVLLVTNGTYSVGDFVPITTGAFTTCLLEGTRIATPTGETAVEALSIGDLVLGADGRVRPVRWIGRQSVAALFADPMASFPVRITAGALGDDTPTRDLLVSPDHAMLVDGLLVQAGALVDGIAIRRDPAPAALFTYFHIELEDHALVLAEGAPAETYVDHVTRRRFDNFAEYEALYGTEAPAIAELPLPRVKSARQLPRAVRARLDARTAAIAGVAQVA